MAARPKLYAKAGEREIQKAVPEMAALSVVGLVGHAPRFWLGSARI
jgi:hypothetical protein